MKFLLLALFIHTYAKIQLLDINSENEAGMNIKRIYSIIQAKQVAYIYTQTSSVEEFIITKVLNATAKTLINLGVPVGFLDFSYELVPVEFLDFRYDLVIFTTSTAKLVEDYFDRVKSKMLFNANEKYLIVMFGSEDEFLRVFEVLWKFKIKRVVVMDEFFGLHTTNLYKDNCVYENKSRFLFKAEDVRREIILEAYNKEETIFSGCKFRIGLAYNPPGTVKFNQTKPGSEIESFMMFAKTKNLTINYDVSTFYNSTKTPENFYANSLRKIYDKITDAHFSMCNGDEQYYEDFATSTYWVKAQFTLIVPKALRIHSWKGVVSVFSFNLWMIIGGVFVIVVVTAFLLNAFTLREIYRKDFDKPLMQNFCILIGKGAAQPESLYCRILFLSWTISAMLILSSYESQLFSFLTQPSYEVQVDSVDKLVDSGWKIVGHGKYINMITNTRQILRTRYVNNSNIILAFPNVTQQRNVALYGVLDNVLFHLSNDEARKIFILNLWSTTFTRMLAVKGFPLLEQFNEFLLRLWQSGILTVLMDKYKPMKFDVEDKSFHKGGLDSLFIIFYIYLMGLFISLLVFLYEFCIKRADRQFISTSNIT